MHRIDVINKQLSGDGCYLEIGVHEGGTFWGVKARTRIGVDPAFRGRRLPVVLPLTRIRRAMGARTGVLLYQETSDAFFSRAPDWQFDCVLIDGLHTAEQAYTDTLNALEHLAPGGLIVIHDCNPKTETAALARWEDAVARPDFANLWNGTVWKALVRLRTRTDLKVRVLDCDQGLGLVTRDAPESVLSFSEQEISTLGYADLAADRERLLNLTAP